MHVQTFKGSGSKPGEMVDNYAFCVMSMRTVPLLVTLSILVLHSAEREYAPSSVTPLPDYRHIIECRYRMIHGPIR